MSKGGRPKSADPRSKVIRVRVTEDEYGAIQQLMRETKAKEATAIYGLLQESSLPERTRIFCASMSEKLPSRC